MEEDFLKDMASDKGFWFHNGAIVRNIYELAREINNCPDTVFSYHCNKDHDDFANWIGGVIGDIWLSQKLRGIKDKKAYLNIINARIKYLEKKKARAQQNKQLAERVSYLLKNYSHVWLLIILFIASSIITSIIYFQYHTLMNVRSLDEKINYMESRTTCYNNYFNDQILKTKALLNTSLLDLDSQCVFNYSTSIKIPSQVYENNPENIPKDSINLASDVAIIYINGSSLAIFANSSSMVPTLSHNTKAIEIKPNNTNELHIGDIISYRSREELIVHRIIDIGRDNVGWYAVTKGDNNDVVDPDKIRFESVNGKIVVLIY